MSSDAATSLVGAEVTSQQAAANRANAQKSTGPRTAAGKAIVAFNGVQHGIHAVNPVLPGESPHLWRRFKAGMYVSLAPLGMVELTLAERITLTAWRLRRVTRFETESMRQALGDADYKLEQHFQRELNDGGNGDVIARAHKAAQQASAVQTAFDKYLRGADSDPLTNEDVNGILSEALAVSGRKRFTENSWPPNQPNFKGWTVELVRGALGWLNGARPFRDLDQFTRAVGAEIVKTARAAAKRPGEIERKRLENRRANQMPDANTSDLIIRYEAHLSRQLHRDLHELERLQAIRLGKPVAPAIAIDVEVSGGTKSD